MKVIQGIRGSSFSCWNLTSIDKLCETLKSKVVSVETDPLTIIKLFKVCKVQRYARITILNWGGFNLIVSLKECETYTPICAMRSSEM